MSADNPREAYVTGETQGESQVGGQSETQSGNQSAPTANGNHIKDTMVDSKVCWALSFLVVCVCKASANLSLRISTYSTFVLSNKLSDTAAAINTIKNHPIAQSTKETLAEGTIVLPDARIRSATDLL